MSDVRGAKGSSSSSSSSSSCGNGLAMRRRRPASGNPLGRPLDSEQLAALRQEKVEAGGMPRGGRADRVWELPPPQRSSALLVKYDSHSFRQNTATAAAAAAAAAVALRGGDGAGTGVWRCATYDGTEHASDGRAVLASFPAYERELYEGHMSRTPQSALQGKLVRRHLAEREAARPEPVAFGGTGLSVGEAVECRWRGKAMWYPAAIEACCRERGVGWLYDVRFDDGEVERGVEAQMVRAPVAVRLKKHDKHYWYEVKAAARQVGNEAARVRSPQRGRLRARRRPASGVVRPAVAHAGESTAARRARCAHSAPPGRPPHGSRTN